jgi:uncharacterized protein
VSAPKQGIDVAGLLLTPGAGADRNQPALVAIDDILTRDRITVSRIDFPYRVAGRRTPDRSEVLLATVRSAAADMAAVLSVAPSKVALGGRSMGGRICSMAVAGGQEAAALVLISYPLHPPGKPDRLRTEHFGSIGVPTLFISGTKDAFGSPAELEAAATAIPAPITHVWIDGGDHGLRRRDELVAQHVRDWLLGPDADVA